MKQMIPYEKLSKKEKKKRDGEKRGSWMGLNPVTRRSSNPKAYNRRKAQQWKKDGLLRDFFLVLRELSCYNKKTVKISAAEGE